MTEKPLPFIYQFGAGAIAGVSEVCSRGSSGMLALVVRNVLTYLRPLDSVDVTTLDHGDHGTSRLLSQAHRPPHLHRQLQGKAPVAGQDYYTGMLDCFKKIVKNEGASRLYRGIGAPIMMEAPKRATKFAANDSWGIFYRRLFNVDKPTQPLAILTGATAGATESFVVVPFELVKIRLQDRASAGKYSGIADCVVKTVKNEGPLALYNGLESTLWRHILWNAGYFGCIFQVKELLPKVDKKKEASKAMLIDFASGAIGGTVGTILNTPMDVVKSRIQNTTKIAGQVPKYNWAWPGLGTIMKEEGFSALYKGFLPKVLRLGPGGGVLLVVYTGVMDWFRKMGARPVE
ncbi:uncharacterized protein A1O9_10772 [Exophiala aquamarina CBS 119918]|uniref:Uncharacterized protein n=1 Tax=Exophiala aquamarina CBS 119918 TaxID=1182545 RepID=A0A072NZP9_9EURO|nr:uncharacterized protein A1O9_10772 [Exophiala aquamarina CBS 119918]KEF53324.1 hypothetical protein A1O9_10772 [Exophiala aquamarina CBS 119918]